MNEDETPMEEPDDADEPTYQDWTELQSPVACSWCRGLVSQSDVAEHTAWHLELRRVLLALAGE